MYFPFSPGIPWLVRQEVVVPILRHNIWKDVLQSRSAVIVAKGGLIEHYASLMFAEVIHQIDPGKTIYWTGASKYSEMVKLQGLAKISRLYIGEDTLKKYPVPIFLDQKDFFFYHVLYNYLVRRNFTGKKIKVRTDPILYQIFQNTTIPDFQTKYLPVFRREIISSQFSSWSNLHHFNSQHPFITIFPDVSSYHRTQHLKWKPGQIKSLATLLRSKGIKCIVITEHPSLYYHPDVIIMSPHLLSILKLLPNSQLVLSQDIDYLLLGGLLGSKTVMGVIKGLPHLSLHYNLGWAQKSLNIITSGFNLDPVQVANLL